MRIGTPLSDSATRVMLLGSGELGKEVVIELQRLGVEVIAVDRYADAPAQQVAHRAHVIDMTDGAAIRALVLRERPHLIVPEIEAIATEELLKIDAEGLARVIPTAKAAHYTMNRERIRRLAAEELELPTSRYAFAATQEELQRGIDSGIGYPCFVKPVMSSSGKGQSRIKDAAGVAQAWEYALTGGRVKQPRVIVEGEIQFDYRDHAAHGAARRRHLVLRAHRPRAGGWRLCGILAAAGDVAESTRRLTPHRQAGDRCAGRARHLWRGVVRQG